MEFVDLETARAARGLRLVVIAGVPSPWSEAAKGIFRVKGVPFVGVRLAPGDKPLREWTRSRNAPVAIFDDEPPRTGWADILELAERLEPRVPLVPASAEARVRMFGLSHEIVGEGGLLWCGRVVTLDASLRSEGARGFPLPIARYLGPRYGYVPERVAAARRRVEEAFAVLGDALASGLRAGGPYYFGAELTALDLYSAAAMNIFSPLPEDLCPMFPPARAAFEGMREELTGALPPELLAHRDLVCERHLEMPIQL